MGIRCSAFPKWAGASIETEILLPSFSRITIAKRYPMKSAKHSCKSITTSLLVILRQFGLFAEFLDRFFAGLPVARRTIAAESLPSVTC